MVVVVGESAMRRIQYGRLVGENARRHGRVELDAEAAGRAARRLLRGA